jgi:hypothetical protein
MLHRIRAVFPTLPLLLGLVACGGQDDAQARAATIAHVDSIRPIEEEIRRFRTGVPQVAEFTGGRASREALVSDFVAALAAEDTVTIRELAISRAEFGWLHYPSTRFTTPPYELSPALVWYQIQNYGSRGITRALNRYGGTDLRYLGHTCGESPDHEGENLVWGECVVVLERDGERQEVKIFGPVIERDGSFKFLSYSNRL